MAMRAASLQRLYTPPRRDRFNKNNLNSNSQSIDGLQDNGILYKLIDQRDYQTFRVLSDDQVKQEYQQTAKFARSMSANSLKSSRKSFDFQPPMFGILSKSAKMKKKAWDNQIKKSMENGSEPQNDTIKTLLSNTKKNSTQSLDNKEIDDNIDNESKIPSDFNLVSAVNLMKSKYIENIKVIEKLYNEKIEMEEKFKAMEKQLQLSQSFSSKLVDDKSNVDFNNRENIDCNITSTNKITANEIADLIIEKGFDFIPNKDVNYNEESNKIRSRSANGRLNGNTSRSYSVSPGRFQISPRLQADYDNYLYKQKLIKQKEINDKLLREQYELEKAERLKNISANSPEFLSMINRQKLYEEKKNLKLSEIKQNEIIKSENENLEKMRKHYENLERLSKPTIKHDIDWKEYAALEDNKRKQRIEERKQALSMSLTSNNEFHYMTANKSTIVSPEYYKPFKAKDDPEKIIEKLLKQQQLWDNKLSKTKENIRQSLSLRNTTLQSESIQSTVQSMENRRQYYEMKRKLFNDEKLKKEHIKLEEKKLNEKLKFEKLINSKIHEKSAELSGASLIRAKYIKEKSDKEKNEEEKKKITEQQKIKSARETAAVVKTIIEQSEYERKLKVPSYIELRDVDSIAAEKAAQKRKEMREKLRKQKQDLEEGKRKQPSLIERHEQKIAKDSGYVKALDKINNTIENKSSQAINKVFDDKEKLFLGLE